MLPLRELPLISPAAKEVRRRLGRHGAVWGSRARSTAGWDVTVASASLPWTIDADVARTRGSTEDAPVDEPRSSARGLSTLRARGCDFPRKKHRSREWSDRTPATAVLSRRLSPRRRTHRARTRWREGRVRASGLGAAGCDLTPRRVGEHGRLLWIKRCRICPVTLQDSPGPHTLSISAPARFTVSFGIVSIHEAI